MVAAIDRELQARATGMKMTPEEQLEMLGVHLYDAIGGAYTATRRTDPRIAAQVWAALGDARTVLNVGAGTGSYEPPDREVAAVDPSAVMRAQRPEGAPILFSRTLRDYVLYAADEGAIEVHWSRQILAEMSRNLRENLGLSHDSTSRLEQLMNDYSEYALWTR